MVLHARDACANLSDAGTRPSFGAEPPVQRAEIHCFEQLLLLCLGDAFSWSWMWFRVQGVRAAFEPGGVPDVDGSRGDLEFAGDVGLAELVSSEEESRVLAAFLELRFGQAAGFPGHGVMLRLNAKLELRDSVTELTQP